MSRQTILDGKYRILGYIETNDDGRQKALNSRYEIVGHYDPIQNRTRDGRYRIVATGNVLGALIGGCG